MQDIKQNLADAIRKSRTELGLSQEKLAEILGFDSRTILNIENGRGNPKFEKLYPLVSKYVIIRICPQLYFFDTLFSQQRKETVSLCEYYGAAE